MRSAAIDLQRVGGRYHRALGRFADWLRFGFGAQPDFASESRLFAALDDALGNLEPEERDLIDCRYFKREPLEAIAARCGATSRAIEGRLARTRARLRANITSALRQENLMKPTNQDRRELIEDIFAPAQISSAVSAEEVLRWCNVRVRRGGTARRLTAIAVVFLATAVLSVTFLPRQSPIPRRRPGIFRLLCRSRMRRWPCIRLIRPIVEYVDDERMLSLLDETPAALVRWPTVVVPCYCSSQPALK